MSPHWWLLLAPLVLSAASVPQRELARPVQAELDLAPFDRAPRSGAPAELVPVLAGDKVLVTSTLRLFALDARSLELVWCADPPRGWEELRPGEREKLLAGLDEEHLLVAPAAGERVAVAALQVPQSRLPTESASGFLIRTALPERRLFAFDLATGAPLWDHAPPPRWDGFGGDFARRMSVVASPLVVGSRVLVPCTSDRSSVDYLVACYQLETGALLWSTFVVRGQVERNTFGYALREFAAAPLVAAPGGRVLAQTGLGFVAALELDGGEIVWRSDYPSIPLAKPHGYMGKPIGPWRTTPWRTAPPVVTGDVLLATPVDSAELLAFDLGDGRLLWSVPRVELQLSYRESPEPRLDHLIGEREGLIYLGGSRLSAFAKPEGMRSRAIEPLWSASRPAMERWPRAQLAGDAVLAAHPGGCTSFARESSREHGSSWVDVATGSMVTEEALFVLTRGALHRIER